MFLKKILLPLTERQNSIVSEIADKKDMYKVVVLRNLVELLNGLEGEVKIIAYDDKNVKVLNDINVDSENFKAREDIKSVSISITYEKGSPVVASMSVSANLISEKGDDVAQIHKEVS